MRLARWNVRTVGIAGLAAGDVKLARARYAERHASCILVLKVRSHMYPQASHPSFSSCSTGVAPNASSLERWHEFLSTTFVHLECQPERTAAPFYGQIRSMVSGELHVSRISSSPGVARRTEAGASRAAADYILLSLQVRGRTIITQQEQEVVLTPGLAAFYDSSAAYSLRMPSESEQIVLHLPRRLLAGSTRRMDMKTALAVRPSMPFAQSVFSLAHQLARADPQAPCSSISRTGEVMVELISLLFESLGDEATPPALEAPGISDSALVRRAHHLLGMHISNCDLSSARLAQLCGVSLRRLQHAFHAVGTTVSSQIWSSRLELAASLLTAETNASDSITSVAYAAGFNDFSHFSRRFKERFDLSPRDYRRSAAVPTSGGRGIGRDFSTMHGASFTTRSSGVRGGDRPDT